MITLMKLLTATQAALSKKILAKAQLKMKVIHLSNGKYIGNYLNYKQNPLPHGYGAMKFADGIYVGSFANGKIHGEGNYIEGNVTFYGQFENNTFSHGVVTKDHFANGAIKHQTVLMMSKDNEQLVIRNGNIFKLNDSNEWQKITMPLIQPIENY